MSVAVVRCPSCEQPSRVPFTAIGLVVACPRCQHQFTAVAVVAKPVPPPPPPVRREPTFPEDKIPVVHRSRRVPRPPDDDDVPTVYPPQATGGPFAVALLPVGVPLLWLLLSLTVGPSEFSFMAPVAIAAGTVGLGLGLASIRRWTASLRVRLLLALTLMGYTAAALFYFATPGWLEQVREVAAFTGLVWQKWRPEDRSFEVTAPGDDQEAAPPVPEWKLTTRQFVAKNAVDLYVVAYGPAPPPAGRWSDKEVQERWFNAARDTIGAACAGQLVDERAVGVTNCVAREYVFDLASGRKRVVRLVRSDQKVFYLGVEGPYIASDSQHVRRYFQSFKLTPAGGKKK